MSLWNDLLSGLGHFGQTLGNDLGAAGNAVGSFVRNDVGPSLFRASDFARNSASTIGQDLINGSSPLYRDVFEPIFDPLTNAAGHISSDITGNDAFGNRVDQQSLYDQAHSDNGLITDALSAPSNFLAKGILQPSFHAGTNLGLGLDYLRAGQPTESISPFVEGAMGAGNALFHAANPLLASGMDVAGGLTHGTLNGQGLAGTAEDALSNMGGANGYDLGHEVTSKLPESFQQQHPLLTGGLAMGLDIGAMRGIENPEGALSDLGQSLLNPKAGIENELSRLPLLNRYFRSLDAQNAGANSLLNSARLALLSGSPEEAAATAEQMGHQAAATDAERFNQELSQNPNIADHSNMMMGVTNMDPEKFGSAVSQDAVIAPSIAGINATHDFSQFGGMNGEAPVQLIHSPENLDPTAENVYAYGHDAYTPTVPPPQYAGSLQLTDKLMGDLLENHVAAHNLSPDTQPSQLLDLLNHADVPKPMIDKLMTEAYGNPVVSFTDAKGNQQLLPYTKENIQKAMLAKVEANNGDARATQTGVGIAPPQTFGAKQFQSMDEMKQNVGNLKPLSELENDPTGRKAIQDAYEYLSNVADKAGKNLPNYHPFDSSLVKNQFISQLLMAGDEATPETVAEAMGNLNIPNKDKVLQHIDFPQLNKILDQFRNPVTDYHEIKNFNLVDWDKIPGIVIPNYEQMRSVYGMSEDQIQSLKNNVDQLVSKHPDVKVVQYDANDPEGQAKARIANFPQAMFGSLVGIQPETDKNGKPTGKVKFNLGQAIIGAMGMAMAGHLTNPEAEAGALKSEEPLLSEQAEKPSLPHKPLDIIKPLPQTITPSERLLQQIAQEKQAIENDHLDYLNATGKQGVTPGGLIRNEDGEVTGRFGAVSNNDPWYQEFYKANGRPPSQAELKQIALDHLTNGFTSASGEVPPHEEYNSLLRIEQAVKQDQGSGQPEEPLQVRQFSNTVRTADNALSPETRGQVGDYYNVVHNQDAINAAKDRIAQNVEEAHNFATGDTPPSAEKTATGLGLMQHYDQTGQTDKAVEVAQKMAEDATSQGQAIQALSIINKLSPEGILIYAQRQLNKVNELLPDGKKINLSTEEADQLKTMADTISKMPDGHQKDIATAQMLTKVADKTPKSIGRKLSSLQSMALLLNPKTILMKIGLGHTAFGAFDTAVTKGVGSLVDRGVSLLTGQRTTAAPDVPQLLKNYASGIGEKIQEANAGVNIRQSTPFEEGMKVGGHTFSSAPMQKLEDISNAVIGSVPAGVNKAVYEDSLRGQMKLANTTEVTDEMKQRATLDAQYATFMNKSALSEALTHIKQGMNKVGISGFGAGEGILKFAHVPANIISSSIDYSPVGFVKTLYQLGRDAMQGQGFDQAQFVRNISRAGVGSATMLGVNAALARLGIINGKLNDAKQAVRYEQSQGQRDYQLNASALYRYLTSGFNPDAAKPQTGDKMVTYNWMEPLGTNMAAGAEYAKTQAKDLPTALLHSTVDAVQAASETPMFKGLQTLLSTNDPNTGQPSLVAGAEKVATGMPASFVPTVVNNIRNLTDNTVRNTYPANNAPWYQEMLNQVEDKIPLLSNHLAPRVDVAGNVMQKYPEGNTVLNAFFNPSNSSRLQNNPVANELIRLYQQNNTTNQFPGAVYNSVKSNGTQVNINPQTQAQMQHWMGQMAQTSLQELMSTSQYQQANDTQRASLVAGQLNAIDSAAKEKFLGITPTRSTTSQASTGRPHRPSRPSRHTRVSKRDQLMSQPQPSQLPLLSQ